MTTRRFQNNLLFLSLCALCPLWWNSPARADAPLPPPDVAKATKAMAAGARKFLECLSPDQLATAGFTFKDNERFNWHFIPKPRNGLSLKDMSEDQRALAKAMLSDALSASANTKVLTIMSLEN